MEGGPRHFKTSLTISVAGIGAKIFRADDSRRYVHPRQLVHQGDSDGRPGENPD